RRRSTKGTGRWLSRNRVWGQIPNGRQLRRLLRAHWDNCGPGTAAIGPRGLRSNGLGQSRGGLGQRTRLTQPSFTPDRQSCRGFWAWRSNRACVGGVPPKVPSARFSIEIGGVHWCSRLLPPGVVQSAGIESIETEFIDKLQDDGLGLCIVARNGQGNSTRRSTRPPAFEQMARIDVIKRFDNGPSQFLFDPAAFRHSPLDFYNPAIALARIVVAGIHDDHTRWHAGEQPSRQCR